ncbi:RidA family protein [Georgenia sp. Z1491]|uniref:RidA family protein n=1 Tax=Georgenia sp. Z1491 TaxID=3416707 RepID=UPI003CEAEB4B
MSEQRELVSPTELHPTPGFSHVTVAPAGRTVHVAGQGALAPDFSILGGDDLREQTVAAMRNLEIALASVGGGFEHVVRRTVYTTRPTEFATITEAVEEVQGSTEHPAQSIVGVTGLAVPGMLIEIEATAVVP